MKRPDKWERLPANVIETILWNVELDYCSYEGSKDETINDLLNNH